MPPPVQDSAQVQIEPRRRSNAAVCQSFDQVGAPCPRRMAPGFRTAEWLCALIAGNLCANEQNYSNSPFVRIMSKTH